MYVFFQRKNSSEENWMVQLGKNKKTEKNIQQSPTVFHRVFAQQIYQVVISNRKSITV